MATQHSISRQPKGLFTFLMVAALVAYSEQQFAGDNGDASQQFSNPFFGAQQQSQQRQPNDQLVFSSGGGRPVAGGGQIFSTTTPQSSNNQNQNGATVFINNRPTVATVAPFMSMPTQGPQYINCVNTCPTTPEYNPVCGSDMQVYRNEQKFNCAVRCGADIQIVSRTSCEGLFPMQRG